MHGVKNVGFLKVFLMLQDAEQLKFKLLNVKVALSSLQVAVTVSIMPDTVDTVIGAPDDGWRYHLKHVEQFADINKLYIVVSCWIIIDTYYVMHRPLNINSKFVFISFWHWTNFILL